MEGFFFLYLLLIKFFPTSGTHKPGPQTIPLSKKKNSRSNMITAKTYVEIPGSPSPSPKALQKSEQTCLVGRGCFLGPLSVRTHTERYETEPFSFLLICSIVDKCSYCSLLFFRLPFPGDYVPLPTLRRYKHLCFLIGRNVAWPSQSSLSLIPVLL